MLFTGSSFWGKKPPTHKRTLPAFVSRNTPCSLLIPYTIYSLDSVLGPFLMLYVFLFTRKEDHFIDVVMTSSFYFLRFSYEVYKLFIVYECMY